MEQGGKAMLLRPAGPLDLKRVQDGGTTFGPSEPHLQLHSTGPSMRK